MERNSILWAVALFFGCTVVFGGLRRLTDGQPAGVALAAQFAALAVIVAAVVLYVRRTRD